MGCGCKGGAKKTSARQVAGAVRPAAIVAPNAKREPCADCCRKHLAYAIAALSESGLGYPGHGALAHAALGSAAGSATDALVMGRSMGAAVLCRHGQWQRARELAQAALASLAGSPSEMARWMAVGHMCHAEEECPDTEKAKRIRGMRLRLMAGPQGADFAAQLMAVITETQQKLPADNKDDLIKQQAML